MAMDASTELRVINLPVSDRELFDYVNTSLVEEETFHFLGFEFLHRFNIVHIQNEIIKAREEIFSNEGCCMDKMRLRTLLADYSK